MVESHYLELRKQAISLDNSKQKFSSLVVRLLSANNLELKFSAVSR